MQTIPHPTMYLTVLALTAVAAITDLRSGLIPNRLLWLGLASGVIAHLATTLMLGKPSALAWTLLSAGAGALVCALVPLLLYRFAAIGGGDVKLLAVLGFCAGPSAGLDIELLSFVSLLLYAPAWLAYHGQLWRSICTTGRLIARPFQRRRQRAVIDPAALVAFRFGPAIFIATLLRSLVAWSAS